MMPSTLMLRLLGFAVVALALYGAYWSIDSAGYNRHAAEVREAQAKADKAAMVKLRKLEGEKNANMEEVNRLRANNSKLKRLQLYKSACAGTSASGTNTTTSAGQFYSDVSIGEEEAINEFDLAYRNAAEVADKIVESCRVLNEYNGEN